jgi:hypothetical protein
MGNAVRRRPIMDERNGRDGDRAYYAQRAAEELELALNAADQDAATAHRRLQRVYTERASVGARAVRAPEEIG